MISKQQKKWTLHDTIILTRSQYFEEVRAMTTHLQYLPIHSDCKPRPWYALGRLPRKDARMCILWVLNKIPGRPKRCISCGGAEVRTYKHFLYCSRNPRMNRSIAGGSWEAMSLQLPGIVRRMEGLEHLVGDVGYRVFVPTRRIGSQAVTTRAPPSQRTRTRDLFVQHQRPRVRT
jgi:hypothetical protein